jgi:uncharacterized protein involved in exopolysaccharide biosynthesis
MAPLDHHRSGQSWPEQRAPAGLDARALQQAVIGAFPHNRRRHNLLGVLAIAFIWLLCAGYYLFSPSVYISRWSLILPASNNSSSLTLETIGQASTMPTQPFGSIQVSPKVIYREIASSDQVRIRAAQLANMSVTSFGRPRIRLIDETSLLLFQINGGSAEEAQAKGRALIQSLSTQLDMLRRDEYEKRASMVRDNLQIYQANMEKARERVIQFQQSSGLLSKDQFDEASSSAELMRRRIAEKRSELDKVVAEQRQLMARVGFAPEEAALGLRLISDQSFARLVTAFAEGSATVHENALRYGPNHPVMAMARQKRDGAMAEIAKLARATGTKADPADISRLLLLVSASHQAEILRSIVAGEALRKGLSEEIGSLQVDLRKLEAEVASMSSSAARLEALRKDLLAAEAVFTSASARLDTNRADQFSSYPLVQVLSEPELPEYRSQPRLLYAVAAGIVGTLIVLLAWGMAWIGSRFRQRRSKSV